VRSKRRSRKRKLEIRKGYAPGLRLNTVLKVNVRVDFSGAAIFLRESALFRVLDVARAVIQSSHLS
jgi:hypothetical protein